MTIEKTPHEIELCAGCRSMGWRRCHHGVVLAMAACSAVGGSLLVVLIMRLING